MRRWMVGKGREITTKGQDGVGYVEVEASSASLVTVQLSRTERARCCVCALDGGEGIGALSLPWIGVECIVDAM